MHIMHRYAYIHEQQVNNYAYINIRYYDGGHKSPIIGKSVTFYTFYHIMIKYMLK
jgi:hypothetical protein